MLVEMLLAGGVLALHVFLPSLGYVSSGNSFPKQLTVEEEAEYLRLYKNGDMDARNILVERNLRLVAYISKKYTANMSPAFSDDLISIGTIGLIKAITTFDGTKGSRLATYAVKCINNEILMYMRSSKKYQTELSLQEPVGTDKEGNEVSRMDLLCNEGDSVLDEVDMNLQIKNLYSRIKDVLKGREREIIELRYGLLNGCEKTQKEIGKMLNISRSYVSRIEKKAMKKLQDSMR
jgi:RNA polymerase sporulation-specific sigma factor